MLGISMERQWVSIICLSLYRVLSDLGFIDNQISFLSFGLHAFDRILIGVLFF